MSGGQNYLLPAMAKTEIPTQCHVSPISLNGKPSKIMSIEVQYHIHQHIHSAALAAQRVVAQSASAREILNRNEAFSTASCWIPTGSVSLASSIAIPKECMDEWKDK